MPSSDAGCRAADGTWRQASKAAVPSLHASTGPAAVYPATLSETLCCSSRAWDRGKRHCNHQPGSYWQSNTDRISWSGHQRQRRQRRSSWVSHLTPGRLAMMTVAVPPAPPLPAFFAPKATRLTCKHGECTVPGWQPRLSQEGHASKAARTAGCAQKVHALLTSTGHHLPRGVCHSARASMSSCTSDAGADE